MRWSDRTNYEDQDKTSLSRFAEGLRGPLPPVPAAPDSRCRGLRERCGSDRCDGQIGRIMKTRTKLRFQDLPKDYAALCRLFLPRPIHDAVDYANVVEVTDAMVRSDEL